ncbi:putative Patellin-3 [Cocos nucifera]|uniref:Putative Patellin-3 n=1 Tax=Cocos nucifera TaxID=13894 RepID=A0A8K0IGT9_COCNU|nr:putative Patellin-3 [Cocos nucifera]
MHSYYKEGHPFCYNIYGEFRNNEFDDKAFGNEEKRWRCIALEQVPVQYGGRSTDNGPDFTTFDAVTQVAIKPSSKQAVEIPVTEV